MVRVNRVLNVSVLIRLVIVSCCILLWLCNSSSVLSSRNSMEKYWL